MQQMPDDVDVVPEYVGGLVDFLNTTQNGADAERVTTADLDETLKAAEPLLDKAGVSLPEPAQATDANAFFVSKDYADELKLDKHSALKCKSVVLPAHPTGPPRPDRPKGPG